MGKSDVLKKMWSDPEFRKKRAEAIARGVRSRVITKEQRDAIGSRVRKWSSSPERKLQIMENIEKRFWKYVNRLGEDECWGWFGSRSYFGNNKGCGYGRLHSQKDGKHIVLHAHRLSWEIHNGPIPEDMCVCHHCDNPACVNPKHLFLGTSKDNADDRDIKGRVTRGERKNMAKLTWVQVCEIRELFPTWDGSMNSLGRRYGVTGHTVARIVRWEIWKHAA